jgi:sugar fermentation stimulation protein A
MKFDDNLVKARFIKRLNRFTALVDLDGAQTTVHVANSGRMHELLVEGYPMYLRHAAADHRKTDYDLALVNLGPFLCSADSHLPPYLFQEAFEADSLEPFTGYDSLRREVTLEESRLDILLAGPTGLCYVETKSVTLVEDGLALFPDAPTERGRKHVLTLTKALRAGHRAAVVFVIQRPDALAFAPHHQADPPFAQALKEAVAQGVEVYAYTCQVSTREIHLDRSIPVRL